MAKQKKAARRAVARKVDKKRTIRQFKAAKKAKTARRPAARAARAPGPRSQALPGMEDVRYKDLDRICESISETRADINRYKGEEADLENKALSSMRVHGLEHTYTWSGVTLVRVPGEERLLVRNARQRTASAETPAEPAQPIEPDDDAGNKGVDETVN